jgi:hypothetical protein
MGEELQPGDNMRALVSDRGSARGLAVLAIVGAVIVLSLIAGDALLSRYVGPDSVSQALEGALGFPVRVGDVKTTPIGLKVVVENVALGARARVRSARVRFDLSSIISRTWEPRDATLSGLVWTLPESADEMEPFAKCILLPFWIADRAVGVTIEDGALLDRDGKTPLCSQLSGRFSCASEGEGSREIEVNLKGNLAPHGEFSAEGRYWTFAAADSAVVEDLKLACAGRRLDVAATVAWGAPSEPRAELVSTDFYGGTAKMSLRIGEGRPGAGIGARVELDGCDGAELLRRGLGLDALESGSLSAEIDARADLPDLVSGGLGGAEARCKVKITEAVLSSGGTLDGVLPFKAGAGGRVIESASARAALSSSAVIVQDMTLESEGVTWKVVGQVARDRSLSGFVVGRVPAEMIGGEGTALSLVKAMLADRSGRIPAAFTITGSIDDPRLHFDVERTAEEAAAAGRPQASQLLKAMSRSDIERLNRKVDELLNGLTLD